MAERPGEAAEGSDDSFEQLCVRAVEIAALDLGLDAEALAVELANGEIGLLITYLGAAVRTVPGGEQRANMEALVHRLTTWTRRADADG